MSCSHNTLLHLAKTPDKVRACVRSGISVNAENGDKWTPLHFASAYGLADTVKALLDFGGNANAPDSTDKWTPLHFAAWAGHSDVVDALLVGGANVDARDIDGSAPLHYASKHGRTDAVKMLLAGGANAGARNSADKTPLEVASSDEIRALFALPDPVGETIATLRAALEALEKIAQ